MKKLLALFMAVITLLSFTACNGSDGGGGGGSGSSANSLEDCIGYMEEFSNGDGSNLRKMAPSSVWELREEKIKDLDEVQERLTKSGEKIIDEMREQYGEDTEIKIALQEQKEMDEDELENLAKALKKAYRIDPEDVKEGCYVTLLISLENVDEDVEADSGSLNYTAVKIGKSWYLVDYSEKNSKVAFLPAIAEDSQLKATDEEEDEDDRDSDDDDKKYYYGENATVGPNYNYDEDDNYYYYDEEIYYEEDYYDDEDDYYDDEDDYYYYG